MSGILDGYDYGSEDDIRFENEDLEEGEGGNASQAVPLSSGTSSTQGLDNRDAATQGGTDPDAEQGLSYYGFDAARTNTSQSDDRWTTRVLTSPSNPNSNNNSSNSSDPNSGRGDGRGGSVRGDETGSRDPASAGPKTSSRVHPYARAGAYNQRNSTITNDSGTNDYATQDASYLDQLRPPYVRDSSNEAVVQRFVIARQRAKNALEVQPSYKFAVLVAGFAAKPLENLLETSVYDTLKPTAVLSSSSNATTVSSARRNASSAPRAGDGNSNTTGPMPPAWATGGAGGRDSTPPAAGPSVPYSGGVPAKHHQSADAFATRVVYVPLDPNTDVVLPESARVDLTLRWMSDSAVTGTVSLKPPLVAALSKTVARLCSALGTDQITSKMVTEVADEVTRANLAEFTALNLIDSQGISGNRWEAGKSRNNREQRMSTMESVFKSKLKFDRFGKTLLFKNAGGGTMASPYGRSYYPAATTASGLYYSRGISRYLTG